MPWMHVCVCACVGLRASSSPKPQPQPLSRCSWGEKRLGAPIGCHPLLGLEQLSLVMRANYCTTVAEKGLLYACAVIPASPLCASVEELASLVSPVRHYACLTSEETLRTHPPPPLAISYLRFKVQRLLHKLFSALTQLH